MSLLLEALKKAELAKQAAKEEPPASATPPFTRDKLPDITQPMDIRSDDLTLAESAPAPKRADKPVLELALEEPYREAPPPPAPSPSRPAPSETEYAPPSESTDRKQARQVFEAKELDVNPRKPFTLRWVRWCCSRWGRSATSGTSSSPITITRHLRPRHKPHQHHPPRRPRPSPALPWQPQ
jgi:hypothetical protein